MRVMRWVWLGGCTMMGCSADPPSEAVSAKQAFTSGANLLGDPGFENGISGFEGSHAEVTLTHETTAPLSGGGSLRVGLGSWGNIASFMHNPAWNSGTFAETLTVAATVRVTEGLVETPISFCAVGYYQNDSNAVMYCQDVDAGSRETLAVAATATFDPTREIDRVYFWLRLNGPGSAEVLMDDAEVVLWEGEPDAMDPPDPPGDPGGQELLVDGSFESGIGAFEVSGAASSVQLNTTSPISGSASLGAHLDSWGNTLTELTNFPWNSGTFASGLRLQASVRIDSGLAGTPVSICPAAYYQDSSQQLANCQDLDGGTRSVQSVDLTTALDDTRELDRVYFWVRLDGAGSVELAIDDASLILQDGSSSGGSGGSAGTGGSPGSGGSSGSGATSTGGSAGTATTGAGASGGTGGTSGTGGGAGETCGAGDPGGSGEPTASHSVSVTLRPHPSVVNTGNVRVSFGMPLPPGLLTDPSRVLVRDSTGQEIAAFTRALAPWRSLPPASVRCSGIDPALAPGLRSILVQFDRAFSTSNDEMVEVVLNADPSAPPALEVPVQQTYRLVDEGTFQASHAVFEPEVYAILPPNQLACAGIGTTSAPAGRDPDLADTDTGQENFFYTSINEFFDWPVTEEYETPYLTNEANWLYDRPQTFLNGYVRTGNFDMLREGFRAAHFYLNQLYRAGECGSLPPEACAGYFKMKNPDPLEPYKDEKYSYPEVLWTWYLLSGDDEPFSMIDDTAIATRHGDSSFDITTLTGGFTERNAGNALLAESIFYEATGDNAVCARIVQGIGALEQMQDAPTGVAANGCFNYVGEDWAPEVGFSPWMSRLLAHALVRAYQITADARIPGILSALGSCIAERGTYVGSFDSSQLRLPFYGGAAEGTPRDLDGWPERQVEHAIDVSYALAMGALFTPASPERTLMLSTIDDLITTHGYLLGYWTRSTEGRPIYRLQPPRKYNYWYHGAGGIGWLLGGPAAF